MSSIAAAKRELEEFLSSLPSFKRKVLELLYEEMTAEEEAEYLASLTLDPDALSQLYLELLGRVPEKSKEYCSRAKKLYGAFAAWMPLPRVPRGRPRLDDLAEEAATLENCGLSHAQTARRLNERYANEIAANERQPASADSIRKLLYSRYERPEGWSRGQNS